MHDYTYPTYGSFKTFSLSFSQTTFSQTNFSLNITN
jgi:hypothetical protein